MLRINNKKQFYYLASLGKCGNTPKTWISVKDYWPDRRKYPIVSIRNLYINKPVKPAIHWTDFYELGVHETPGIVINSIPKELSDPKELSKYTNKRKVQGELGWINGNWWLYYTHTTGYMRQALAKDGQHACGNRAIQLLKYYCYPSDFDDLMDLFDKYTVNGEYPVIEFSVLCGNTGRLNRPLYIWEIRHY